MTAYLQNKTGKQIQIGCVGVGLFPALSIRVYDLGVKNPTPFSPGYFLTAPTVDAEIDVGALLHQRIGMNSSYLTILSSMSFQTLMAFGTLRMAPYQAAQAV